MTSQLIAQLAGVAALNGWIAWRYSRVPIGQDVAMWMLWGMTGARPYRDFVDCKPPGIHVWVWLLSRLTGRRVAATALAHHLAIGAIAVALTAQTGTLEAGLLFTALGQSAWLHAYHGWLEALSGGLLALSFVLSPWLAALALMLAVAVNLKLAPSALLLLLISGWWLQAALLVATAVLAGALVALLAPGFARDLWYALVVVPRRMSSRRWRGYRVRSLTSEQAVPLLLVAPAVAAAAAADPSARLLVPLGAYAAFNALGGTWRPYHWLPIAACAVAAPPAAALVLVAEWVASGLYLGDIAARTKPAAAAGLRAARRAGTWLRDHPGSLWTSSEFTQLYIYAGRAPALALVEQVEIRDVIPERRAGLAGCRRPDLVVPAPGSTTQLDGYAVTARIGPFAVLARS